MTGPLHLLPAIDAAQALAADGPLASVTEWIAGMEHVGRTLGYAGCERRLKAGASRSVGFGTGGAHSRR